MSANKRKIGLYYLKLKDKEIDGKCYPGSTINKLLEYVNGLGKIDKIKKIPEYNKFYFLDSVSLKPSIIDIIFKIAKTHHSPPIISEITALERANPKELTEGDAEKTHIVLKYIDNSENIILLFEERRSGLSIARAINYLNDYANEMFEKNPQLEKYDIDYYLSPSKEFLDSLMKFGRITIGRIIFDKSLLQHESEFLASTGREKSIRRDIELIIKSEKYEKIMPDFIKEYYMNNMINTKNVKRIRLEGKSMIGNPLTLDTEKMKEYDYVEVELERTGTVNSESILNRLNTMIKDKN